MSFEFQNDVFESRTADRPVIGLWAIGEIRTAPKTIAIEVYRLADLGAAIESFRSIRDPADLVTLVRPRCRRHDPADPHHRRRRHPERKRRSLLVRAP